MVSHGTMEMHSSLIAFGHVLMVIGKEVLNSFVILFDHERKLQLSLTASDEVPYGDLTLKSRITKMKDRKRKRNAPTSPIPEPLDEPEDHNPIRLVHFAPTPQIIETSKGLEEQGGG